MGQSADEGLIFKPVGIPPPPQSKKSDRIAEEIKRWIVQQDLQTGDRLPPEQELAPWFSCGKGTIREALKSLEVQGLIVMRTGPKGGPVLNTPSYARTAEQLRTYLNFKHLDVNHIYNMRVMVEPELAVQTASVMTDELLETLRANTRECREIAVGGGKEVRNKELDFHVLLALHCPDPLLSFHSLFNTDLLRRFIVFEEPGEDEFHRFTAHNCSYHERLIDAIVAEDPQKQRSIVLEHIEDSKERSLKLCAKVASNLLLPESIGSDAE